MTLAKVLENAGICFVIAAVVLGVVFLVVVLSFIGVFQPKCKDGLSARASRPEPESKPEPDTSKHAPVVHFETAPMSSRTRDMAKQNARGVAYMFDSSNFDHLDEDTAEEAHGIQTAKSQQTLLQDLMASGKLEVC